MALVYVFFAGSIWQTGWLLLISLMEFWGGLPVWLQFPICSWSSNKWLWIRFRSMKYELFCPVNVPRLFLCNAILLGWSNSQLKSYGLDQLERRALHETAWMKEKTTTLREDVSFLRRCEVYLITPRFISQCTSHPSRGHRGIDRSVRKLQQDLLSYEPDKKRRSYYFLTAKMRQMRKFVQDAFDIDSGNLKNFDEVIHMLDVERATENSWSFTK